MAGTKDQIGNPIKYGDRVTIEAYIYEDDGQYVSVTLPKSGTKIRIQAKDVVKLND